MAAVAVVLAVFLTLYIFRFFYAKNILRNLTISLSVSSHRAVEGETLILTEVLTNKKWLPLPWVSVKFQTAKEIIFDKTANHTDAYYRNDMFHILMHQKITRRLPFECTRRGYYAFTGLVLSAWDILMEHKHIEKCPDQLHITVYPATLPKEEAETLYAYIYGHLPSPVPINPDPFTFVGIREYAPGDPMRAINFKASARGHGLMSNIWDFTTGRQVVIILDAKRYGTMYNQFYEDRGVSIAATLVAQFSKLGTPLQLLTNGKSVVDKASLMVPLSLGNTQEIMDALAYINFEDQEIAPLDFGAYSPQAHLEYYVITPYYNQGVKDMYQSLRDNGARVSWLMPGEKPLYEDMPDDILFI